MIVINEDSLILNRKLFIAVLFVIGNMHLFIRLFLYLLALGQHLEQIPSCSSVVQGLSKYMLGCYFLFFSEAFALVTSSLFFFMRLK